MSGYYVYTLVDPRCGSVFYVGKGKGKRHAAHVAEWRRGVVNNRAKFDRIDSIIRGGHSVEERIVQRDLSEADAFDAERRLIAEIGPDRLTNAQPGGGPMTLEQYRERTAAILARVAPFERWYSAKKRTARDVWWWAKIVLGMAEEAGIYTLEPKLAAAMDAADADPRLMATFDDFLARAQVAGAA